MIKICLILLFAFCLNACDAADDSEFADRNLPEFDQNKVHNIALIDVIISDEKMIWGQGSYIFKTDEEITDLLDQVAKLIPPPVLVIVEKNRSLRNNEIYSLIENSNMCRRHNRCYFVKE